MTLNVQGGFDMAVKKAKKKAVKKVVKKKVVKKTQCAGKTKDGKRCKRTATPPSKMCHLHKRKK